jgi:hypothetical protein
VMRKGKRRKELERRSSVSFCYTIIMYMNVVFLFF